ncbi:helix-turn-helix transcriptional regulator [Marinobacterium rhizophilum]|uniref:Helix-turn-helix transcriptional regulator n=1 Tax=Marinobacterium rhizophilum TaxID=420402 RepID=A0ABY5HJC9_9GAMM|nr:helix-turn-helix transcriptional regulator [Marinobacterium rhizophilum]
MDQARDSIDAHLGESISLADLACCVGVTARTLQNGFQRFLDCTPTEYIREFP